MANRNLTCGTCSAQFESRTDRPYCSMACYRAAQRAGKYVRGSIHEHDCTECGARFSGRPIGKRRNGGRANKIFCSRGCYDKHRSSIVKAERSAECLNCGRAFIRPNRHGGKYCSIGCRTEHKRPRPVHCVNCGCWFTAVKPIKRKSGIQMCVVSAAKTCSWGCHIEWMRRNPARKAKISQSMRSDRHPNWQGGSHYGDKRGAGWQAIAEKCRERHGRQCKHCGMSEADSLARGWGRLQVNHIVPFHQWRNKRRANAQSNLEALCKSCHTKADWKWRKENPIQMSLAIFR